MRFATVPAAFAAATAADPTRPLLTWYDDATGERAELSGATVGNWVAKTANLLVDGCGLGPGDTAVVDLPSHWQSAAVLLGSWSAGLRVILPATGGDAADAPGAAVAFATGDRAGRYVGVVGEVYGLGLAPMAAPLPQPPPGVADFITEVRAHGDHFTPPVPVAPDDPATTVSHRELVAAAAERAAALGVTAGARVLVDVTACPDPLDWLLGPLVAGASTVLCRAPDPAALPGRVAAEHVTLTLPASPSRRP